MITDLVVTKLDAARIALAEAKTMQETKRILDVATAAEIYAKRQQLGDEAIKYATAIKVEALAQLGRMIKASPKNPGTRLLGGGTGAGGAVSVPPAIPTYSDLGLDKKVAQLAQDIADLSEDQVDKVKAGVVSLSKAHRLAKTAREEENREPPTPVSNADSATCHLICGEIANVYGTLPASSVNLVVTDPPYSEARLDGAGNRR